MACGSALVEKITLNAMAAKISNYAQVVNWILEKAVSLDNVNMAREGDIYAQNYLEDLVYPMVFVSATQPVTETENYWTYNLTLYYFDKITEECEDRNAVDGIYIRSNGVMVLSKLVNMIRNADWCYDLGYDNSYHLFGETAVFADMLLGVYTQVAIKVPKTSVC